LSHVDWTLTRAAQAALVALCAFGLTACPGPEEEPPVTQDDAGGGGDDAGGGGEDAGADAGGEDGGGDDADVFEPGAFDALRGTVTVYRDDQGIRHIYAEYLEDLYFMNGYYTAKDRFIQLEFYRRIATGTLSELVGGLDPSTIATDSLFRTLGLKREAKRFWEEEADQSSDAGVGVQSYSEGVNAFLGRWGAGEESIPAAAEILFQSPRFVAPWEPADSLAIGRLLAFQLSYDADADINLTALRQDLLTTFTSDADEENVSRRAGLFHDVLRFEAATGARHIDDLDTSTPALTQRRVSPRVDTDDLRTLVSTHHAMSRSTLLKALDPLVPTRKGSFGSNNWVVTGDLTATGHAQVANDPHLGLSMPTVFYPIHLDLSADGDGREPIRVIGASYPGVPGVVVGRTDDVAWGTTTGYYDYCDVYLEQVTGGADVDTPAQVTFEDAQVAVQTRTEMIGVGFRGMVTQQVPITIEVVPHHGPILPIIENNRPRPRAAGDTAVSVKWEGLNMANEVEFLTRLYRAEAPAEVEEALDFYKVGSSNFVFGFTSGDIFYSGQSNIPVREAGAFGFDPRDQPDGPAPVFVQDGTGGAEWTGYIPEEEIPHAYNPEKGYVITANNDHVGNSFDNNPFNDERYYGALMAQGFRGERIEEQLLENTADDGKLDVDVHLDMIEDDQDNLAERFVPHFVSAIDDVLDGSIDEATYPDLAALRVEVDGEEESLQELRDLLDGWDFTAPSTRAPLGEDVDRSAAATLFNVAMVYFYRNVFADEYAMVGLWDADSERWRLPNLRVMTLGAALFLLERPEEALTYDEAIGDSWIFDDMSTPETEGRRTALVRAILQARARLGSPEAFGARLGRDIPSPRSQNQADWIWGNLHGLTVDALVPVSPEPYQRPKEGLPFYSRPGGELAVSPCNQGHNDFNFTCTAGSSLRMVHDLDPDGPVTYNSIPGGPSGDPESPYGDSQLETWDRGEAVKMLWTREEVEAGAVETEVFPPAE
jgi:penicillin amidase